MGENMDEFLKIQNEQCYIIRKQANIIDTMFVLLCNYMTMEELKPLLNDLQEVAEKETK
jgi:hypothetical protein